MTSTHKAMPLLDIFNITTEKVKIKAKNCKAYKIKYKSKDRARAILLVKCFEDYSDMKGHFVTLDIKPLQGKPINTYSKRIAILKMPMKVNCSCPYQQYWGSAYNLTKNKMNIRRLNTETREPNIRDPKRVNIVCKHITAVTEHLKSQSIYKALIGNTVHNTIPINVDDNDMLNEYSELETVGVEDCKQILLSQGINIPDLSETNFEEKLIIFGVIPQRGENGE